MHYTDLKVAETEKKVKKEKEAKLEKTVEIQLKEEKLKEAKPEAKSFEKTPERPKGKALYDEIAKY